MPGVSVTATGAEVAAPPSETQSLQADPFHARCQIAPSVERTKTLRMPSAWELSVGAEVALPPIDAHADQPLVGR